jgi:hypothetical protein
MVGALYTVIAGNVVVLVIAAIAKLRRPTPFVSALRRAGLPASTWLAGAVAIAELTVVLAALFGGAAGLLVLGMLDLVMASFLVRLRHRAGIASCGCFGERSTPVTSAHIAVNVLFALAALIGATNPAIEAHTSSALWRGPGVVTALLWVATVVLSGWLWLVVITQPRGTRGAIEIGR